MTTSFFFIYNLLDFVHVILIYLILIFLGFGRWTLVHASESHHVTELFVINSDVERGA
jgi:hypothetical protein